MVAVFEGKVHAAILEENWLVHIAVVARNLHFIKRAGFFTIIRPYMGLTFHLHFSERSTFFNMLSRKLHGDETKAYLENIYQHHAMEVSFQNN